MSILLVCYEYEVDFGSSSGTDFDPELSEKSKISKCPINVIPNLWTRPDIVVSIIVSLVTYPQKLVAFMPGFYLISPKTYIQQ